MDCKTKRLFEFGSFCIDTRECTLSRDGKPVPLTPKTYEILLALVENHGHTLGKRELIDRVWADTFVEVGNLSRNISTLRSLLGDDTHQPRYIKTMPKRGYRFDAEVREIIEEASEQFVEHRSNDHSTKVAREPAFLTRRSLTMISAVAGVLFFVVLAWTLSGRSGGTNVGLGSGTKDPEALELYQKGRELWQDRSGESLHQATLLLERATSLDPSFARAHAALADAYAFDGSHRVKAIDTAQTAIELDPNLGEPHATIGFVRMFWEWKLREAETHFKRAIELSPNYATGHQWYAINLQATGQGNAALAEMKRALEIEPGSLAINADLCQTLYFNRRLDEAEAQCMKTLAMDADFLNAKLYLYDVLTAKGKHDDATSQFFQNELQLAHYSAFPGQLAELKASYETAGIRGFWRKRIEMLKQFPSADYAIALYHARLNERDEAFHWLNRAYENRDLNFLYFLGEPTFFVCCYSDPRWAELQDRLLGRQNTDLP